MSARREYDYILIDTPPNLGVLTTSALTAADAVIIPLELGADAWRSLPRFERTLDKVRKLNPSLQIGAILCTKDRQTNLCREIEALARETYGDSVLKAVIPLNARVAEAPLAGKPVGMYAPRTAGDIAYQQATQELEERYGRR